MKVKVNTKETINSILIAIVMSAFYIANIVRTENIGIFIMSSASFIIIFTNLINTKKEKEWGSLAIFISVIFTIILFDIYRIGINQDIILYIQYILMMGLLPMIVIRYATNFYKIAKYIIMIYIFVMPLFMGLNLVILTPQDHMSISYMILPLLFSIIYVILKSNIKIKFKILIMVLSIPYCQYLISYSSRGVVVALIIFTVLLKIISSKNNMRKISKVLIITIILIVIILNFANILIYIRDILQDNNISIYFIDKNIRLLLEKDDITNGRSDTYKLAIEGIKNHPIIGNGIYSFNRKYDTYPHNFILHILYDGGIIYLIIFAVPVLYGIYIIILKKDVNEEIRMLILFSFSFSIVRLSFSWQYFKEPFFWIYISLVLREMSRKPIKEEGVKNETISNSNNTNI